MIWLAIIVEGILEKWPDMGILFALQFINGGVGACDCAPNTA